MNSTEYGLRIRQERKRLGLTQDELASALSLSRQTIVLYENGRSLPDMACLDQMRRLDMDVLYLMTGQPSPQACLQYFDWERHEAVIRAIQGLAKEYGLVLTPEKLSTLVRLCYERSLLMEKFEEPDIRQLLKLVA